MLGGTTKHSGFFHTGVCEQNTPPENDYLGNISLQSAKSGAGEQFLPLDCRAEVHLKEVFLSTDSGRLSVLVPSRQQEAITGLSQGAEFSFGPEPIQNPSEQTNIYVTTITTTTIITTTTTTTRNHGL